MPSSPGILLFLRCTMASSTSLLVLSEFPPPHQTFVSRDYSLLRCCCIAFVKICGLSNYSVSSPCSYSFLIFCTKHPVFSSSEFFFHSSDWFKSSLIWSLSLPSCILLYLSLLVHLLILVYFVVCLIKCCTLCFICSLCFISFYCVFWQYIFIYNGGFFMATNPTDCRIHVFRWLYHPWMSDFGSTYLVFYCVFVYICNFWFVGSFNIQSLSMYIYLCSYYFVVCVEF